jgi:hypothetical protein
MSNAIARRTFLTTAAAATAAFGAPSRARHRTIEVGDVALERTSCGSGTPVALLANAGWSAGYFDHLAGMLAGRPLELPWLAGGVIDLQEGHPNPLLPRGARHSRSTWTESGLEELVLRAEAAGRKDPSP